MLLTLLSFCIHLAFTMDISMHMDTRYWCPFKRRSAAQLAVFIHFYRKGMGAKLPSWPLHVGIRSKGPLFTEESSCDMSDFISFPHFSSCFLCKRSVRNHKRDQQNVDPVWQPIQTGQLKALSKSLTGTSIFGVDSIFNLSLLKTSCMVTLEVGRQVCDLG